MSEHIKDSIVNAFRKKIGSDTALRSIFTPDRVRAGQKVIENAKKSYFDNAQEMAAVFRAAAGGDINPQQIYEATKSLKAQTEGLGFIFLMELSNSLYKFLQERIGVHSAAPKEFDKDESMVVRKHAEAIIAALDKQERGKGGMVESGILNNLDLLKRKYTKPGS